MAEAAGLVLGGVALVGLISTCVEISEYLESAKNRAGDLKMALTKVNLIKQRLDDWGAARAVRPADISPDPRGNHTTSPMTCRVLLLIEDTLKRMKVLLDETNSMSRRHSLRSPNHQRHLELNSCPSSRTTSFKLPCRSHSVTSGTTSLPPSSAASSRISHPRIPRLLLSLPLKVLWVFQDRKRFDRIIDQLDFLLSNLEKISDAPQRRHDMAPSSDPEHYRYCQTPPEDNDSGVDIESIPDQGNSDRQLHPSQGQPIQGRANSRNQPGPPKVNNIAHRPQNMPGPLASGKGVEQREAQSACGRISGNRVSGNGVQLAGNIGAEPKIERPFRAVENNEALDGSLQALGDVTERSIAHGVESKKANVRQGKEDN